MTTGFLATRARAVRALNLAGVGNWPSDQHGRIERFLDRHSGILRRRALSLSGSIPNCGPAAHREPLPVKFYQLEPMAGVPWFWPASELSGA